MLILSNMSVFVTFEICNYETNHVFCFFLCVLGQITKIWHDPEAILGQLMSARRNVKVEDYKERSVFKGRAIWFKNSDNPAKHMAPRLG